MYGNRWLLKLNFFIGGLDRNYCKKIIEYRIVIGNIICIGR